MSASIEICSGFVCYKKKTLKKLDNVVFSNDIDLDDKDSDMVTFFIVTFIEKQFKNNENIIPLLIINYVSIWE